MAAAPIDVALLHASEDQGVAALIAKALRDASLNVAAINTSGGDVPIDDVSAARLVLAVAGSGAPALTFQPRSMLLVLTPGAEVPESLAGWPTIDLRSGVDPRSATTVVQAVRSALQPPAHSSSVASVLSGFQGDVPAVGIARSLYDLHPEYAGTKGAKIRLQDRPDARRQSTLAWLREVRGLFDEAAVPELHGRTVVFGLALAEPDLAQQLEEQGGRLGRLVDALTPPPDDALSSIGRALWRPPAPAPSDAGTSPPDDPSPGTSPPDDPVSRAKSADTVPTHTDNPATQDSLQRKGFARVLASRIRSMRVLDTGNDREYPRGRSFLVHLNGHWGAGKTSILNFIREELEQGKHTLPFEKSHADRDPWIVVNFNAWQHQRIIPPWWWLMSTVYADGFKSLRKIDKVRAVKVWVRERLWRARAGLVGYALAVVAAGSLVLLWMYGPLSGFTHRSSFADGTAKLAAIGGAISVVVGTAGLLRGLTRSMLSSSTRGAREYIESTRDPMQAAKEHFADLVRWLHYPVAIFIDDLDRCKSDYIVQLLEGIQTLFRDAPVVYVVAADRDWLSDSYADEYSTFHSLTDEPGRPLGYLFLEKTFQLSASVPTMAPALASFWGGLLQSEAPIDAKELEAARDKADEAFEGMTDEHDIRRDLVENPGATPLEQQARVEAAAVKLAAPEFQQGYEHVLRPFSELLDSNPRALKRLVNAYGIARDVETLGGVNLAADVEQLHRTALWTILSLRWPRLADYLAEHPAKIAAVGNGGAPPPADVPVELAPLFRDPRVVAVVEGDAADIRARLDEAAVRASVGLA